MSGTDALVAGYLERLERAAAGLPPDRRSELLEGIAEHISSADAVDEAGVRTLLDRLGEPEEIVAAAREDLTGPAWQSGWGPPPTVSVPRGTGHELAAVLMLTLGSFLPVLGWLVGVVLLWTSSLWRVREKVLGTLVVPLGPGVVLVGGAFLPFLGGGGVCTGSGELEVGSGGVGGNGLPPPPTGPPPLPAPPPPGPDQGSVRIEGESLSCTGTGLDGWPATALVGLALLAPVVVAVVLMRLARRRAAQRPVLVPQYGPPPSGSPWGGLEVAAVLVLGLGGLLLPVVGPLVGLALVLGSPRWTRPDKLVAVALCVLPLLLPLARIALPGPAFPGLGAGELLLLGLLLLGPALAAAYLVLVLQRRR